MLGVAPLAEQLPQQHPNTRGLRPLSAGTPRQQLSELYLERQTEEIDIK